MAKIGVFDSGLGGLSIVDKLFRKAPNHSIIYFGDTAHLPYGSKSVETVRDLSQKAINFLIAKDVDMIVVACNTVSSVALPFLQQIYKLPVIGVVEAGVKAALDTQAKSIGIIGTHNTIKSGRYQSLLLEIEPDLKIIGKECPLFVSLVEEGMVEGKIPDLVVEHYLSELKGRVQALILGCTHYPALGKTISKYMGPDTKIADASIKIIEYIKEHMEKEEKQVKHEFYVSDRVDNFQELSKLFLDKKIENAEIIKWV